MRNNAISYENIELRKKRSSPVFPIQREHCHKPKKVKNSTNLVKEVPLETSSATDVSESITIHRLHFSSIIGRGLRMWDLINYYFVSLMLENLLDKST